MPRNSRVIMNRSIADAIALAVADGLLEVGRTIIETADPPDAPPYGQGLVQQGGAIAFVKGKKVGDSATFSGGKATAKPRAAKVNDAPVVVIVGWGFPARFVEFGTVKMAAEPFFVPARDAVAPSAAAIAAPIIRNALG